MISQMPRETNTQMRADFAAIGLLSFQTKYKIIPNSGIQQNESMFTAIFGLSSPIDSLPLLMRLRT